MGVPENGMRSYRAGKLCVCERECGCVCVCVSYRAGKACQVKLGR